jgi:hypothetical protein
MDIVYVLLEDVLKDNVLLQIQLLPHLQLLLLNAFNQEHSELVSQEAIVK